MLTQRGEHGCGPEDVAHELGDAHERPDTHPVHLLERVEHRHVARPPHLGRVHYAPWKGGREGWMDGWMVGWLD